jgi:trimethylamine--corrinoid protein Co-methyltransferase
MAAEGFSCNKPIELLARHEIETIHEMSLEILKETGVVFHWEPALKVLESVGCKVDFSNHRVKFSENIVDQAIKSSPGRFGFKARDRRCDLEFFENKVHFSSQASPFIYDFDTGERRTGRKKDIADITTIQDALKNIHAVFTSIEVLSDVPMHVQAEWILAEQIRNTAKALNGLGFHFCAKWHIEMAKAAGIELVGAFTCAPPLTYTSDQCDGIMRFAQQGWGFMMCPGISCGATGPATLAGTLLQQNAEVLAGLVLSQAVRKGVGYIYSVESMPMDMRSGNAAIGIEQYMLSSATAQLARFYHIPSASYNSFTGGKLPDDQQVGYEKAMAAMIMAQSGINYVIGAGGIDDESCYSIEQLVIDNEMYGMIGRFLEGIKVDAETLAAEIIKKVGPLPGNYLREEHTRKWWRREQFIPELNYRLSYEEWIRDGRKSVAVRAKEKAIEILKTHKAPPLSEKVDREISKILSAAEKEKTIEK